jgi:hypothetical protein
MRRQLPRSGLVQQALGRALDIPPERARAFNNVMLRARPPPILLKINGVKYGLAA